MKQLLLAAMILMLIFSCNQKDKKQENKEDENFQKISERFLRGYLDWRPQLAVGLGLHEYDGKVTDYTRVSLDNELKRLKDFDGELALEDTSLLSTRMFYDYRILQSAIRNEIFNFEGRKSYTENPMTYAQGLDVSIYVKRNYAPLEVRLTHIIEIERKIPALFKAALENLADSLPKPLIEMAIAVSTGGVDFLKGDLVLALKEVKNDSLMNLFRQMNDSAISSVRSFISWLQAEKLPKSNNLYAIGTENYKKMLLYGEDIDMSPEKILEIGLTELKTQQAIFNSAARVIDPSKKPSDVYHDIQKEHPQADSLIPQSRKHLESIRQYLIDKDIISIPSEARVMVKETPQFARSTSTASMDAPGPFEKNATEAYYYITPVDPNWSPKQKEDWLSQFDYYTSDNVTVHEAYPGHYVQGLHLNFSNATKIEKIFGSYAFIEGWAHYCEKMMIDEGFGNTGDSVKAAKYRLAQTGDALLRLCRLCVSIKMHCQGMSVDEGTKFFMDNWYQGEKPSRQEALRGTFDPGYLFYTVGKLEILKLREDYKKQEGAAYSLKKFNDAMLDNGMPPIRLLREVLLKDNNSWNDIF